MMKSKFDIESAKNWAKSDRSEPRKEVSKRVSERHDYEWVSSCVIKKNDSVALSKALENSYKFKQKYLNNSDQFSVRVSGDDIACGKIKFTDGLAGLNALLELVKHSARDALNTKKSTQGLKDYIDNLFMNAPQTGSFIYKAEIDLNTYDDAKDDNHRRDLNLHFANKLVTLNRFIKSNESPKYTSLLNNSIDEKLCNHFLNLFSKGADKLEFDFDWSAYTKSPSVDLPKTIVFEEISKKRFKHYKTILSVTRPKSYNKLAVYIEKVGWPEGKDTGTVYTTFHIADRKCTHNINVNEDDFEKFRNYVKTNLPADIKVVVPELKSHSVEIVSLDFDFDSNHQFDMYKK